MRICGFLCDHYDDGQSVRQGSTTGLADGLDRNLYVRLEQFGNFFCFSLNTYRNLKSHSSIWDLQYDDARRPDVNTDVPNIGFGRPPLWIARKYSSRRVRIFFRILTVLHPKTCTTFRPDRSSPLGFRSITNLRVRLKNPNPIGKCSS